MRKPYLILMLIGFLSCTNENSSKWTTVDIQLKSAISGEPISGKELFIQSNHSKGSNAYYSANSGTTDESGNLELGFKAKRQHNYSIRTTLIDAQTYPNLKYALLGDKKLTVGVRNHLNLEILDHGILHVHSQNVDDFDNMDHFSYQLSYKENFDLPDSKYYYSEPIVGTNESSVDEQTVYAGNYELKWTARSNGKDSSGTMDVFVPENGMAEVLIQY